MIERCPVCEAKVLVCEDWPNGRVIVCEKSDPTHFRRVERFGKCPSSELLDQSEIDEERRNHAADI